MPASRRGRSISRRASVLALAAAAIAAGGCGSGHVSTPATQRLEREDLIAVARGLQSTAASVHREVAATRAAWPSIANGMPADTATVRPSVRSAGQIAATLKVPALFSEAQAASLTGPAAGLAGALRTFSRLATRGWQLIGAAVQQIEHGSPVAASFSRANLPLYIESVYDAHFSLAQIGKQLSAGYEKLGGASAFGSSLTPADVQALARAYSEGSDRLHPHVGVKLGS